MTYIHEAATGALVSKETATVNIPFELRVVRKCDGLSDHYYWQSSGNSSECFDSETAAMSDAYVTLTSLARQYT